MSLRSKAITSFNWSLVEGVSSQGITFIVGVFLARILLPSDFGLIGLITVLITICNSIVGSGFSNALIRKLDVNEKDYSTIFFTNILISFVLYALLYFYSDLISIYFEEPILIKIIKISSLVLIINAFTLVQKCILIRDLDFKTQAIISLIASVISGMLGLYLAYTGNGVWSLVYMTLLKQFIYCLGLWINSKWIPKFIFSKESFNELFNYSYKLLLSELINTIYANIYYFIIGKVYSPSALGYYTRADSFQRPFSSNISLGIKRISFPIFSKIQNNTVELKQKFKKFIRINIMLSSFIMFFLITSAKPIVLLLVGDKWITSVFYLQLLCIPGLLYGLQILNLNLLMVKGFSSLNLKLEIIKKIILIPLVVISSLYSIEVLLYCFVAFSCIELFINSYFTNRLISYSIQEQLKDILLFVLIGVGGLLLTSVVNLFYLSILSAFIFKSIIYLVYYVFLLFFGKISEFDDALNFFNSLIQKIKRIYK